MEEVRINLSDLIRTFLAGGVNDGENWKNLVRTSARLRCFVETNKTRREILACHYFTNVDISKLELRLRSIILETLMRIKYHVNRNNWICNLNDMFARIIAI